MRQRRTRSPQAAAWLRASRRPLIVAGGGVIYAEATETLRRFVEQTGIPVGETMAGKGSLRYDHPLSLGAIGATGTFAANRLADTPLDRLPCRWCGSRAFRLVVSGAAPKVRIGQGGALVRRTPRSDPRLACLSPRPCPVGLTHKRRRWWTQRLPPGTRRC